MVEFLKALLSDRSIEIIPVVCIKGKGFGKIEIKKQVIKSSNFHIPDEVIKTYFYDRGIVMENLEMLNLAQSFCRLSSSHMNTDFGSMDTLTTKRLIEMAS